MPQEPAAASASHGLDPNMRRPDGSLKPSAIDHPEDFTRNTGEGGVVQTDGPPTSGPPVEADAAIIPSDAPGG